MLSFPLFPLCRHAHKPFGSLDLCFLVPLLLLFCDFLKLPLKYRKHTHLYCSAHESNCANKTELNLHRLGNWEFNAMVDEFRKQALKANVPDIELEDPRLDHMETGVCGCPPL